MVSRLTQSRGLFRCWRKFVVYPFLVEDDSADLRQQPMLPVASHRDMPANRWRWSDRPESGARCGCSSMVEHRPSKPGMGVRFRPPAPTRKAIATNREIADASAWQSPSLLVRAMHGASRAPNNVKRSARKGGGAPNPGGPRSARAPVEWRGQQPTSKATEPDYAVSAGAGRRNGGNSCDQRGTVRRRRNECPVSRLPCW